MSATPKNTYAALPSVTRGKPIHFGSDPKGVNFLYTCGSTVVIRNLKEPLKCELYNYHQYPPTVARYAPSGFYIASGDSTGTVRIWDTTQKEHILKIELRVLSGPISDLQWSDDSKRIVVSGDGKEKFGAVLMWDSGSSVGEITGHSKCIISCDFKQTRPYRVATGSEDMLCGWFEGPPFKFKKSAKDHSRFVNCVRFSPDGNKLLTVGSDKLGFFYEGKNGDKVGELSTSNGHGAGIYSCSWSPDSKKVATASADKSVKICSENGDCLTTFAFPDDVDHQQLGCLWQGDEIISVSLNGEINYLDQGNPNKPKRILKGHNKAITGLAFDAQRKRLFTGSYDGLIIDWEVDSGIAESFDGKGHSNQINSMHVQGDNLVTCAMDDSVRITPLNGRKYSSEAIPLDSTPSDIAVGKKDLKLIVVAILDSVVVIKDGKVSYKQPVKFQPTCVALNPDENQIAVGGKDNNIYTYSFSGGKLSEGPVLKGHRGPLSAVSYSPNGKMLASADHNREILVWENNQVKIQGWVYHTGRVNALGWSPDSLHVASASLDANLYIWSVADSTKRIFIKDAHRGGANKCLWLDNQTVASVGQDCNLRSWNITY